MSERSTYRLKISNKDYEEFLRSLERLCPNRTKIDSYGYSQWHVVEIDLDDDEYLMLKVCCGSIQIVPSPEERNRVLEAIKRGLI